MTDNAATAPTKSKRNWWKWGFFAALFAFEAAREVAVVEINRGTMVAGVTTFTPIGDDSLFLRGRWLRTDEGEQIVPTAVSIECWKARGQCIEAYVHTDSDGYVFPPEIAYHDAKWTETAVEWTSEHECVRYLARADLRMKKVISVRERTKTGGMCDRVEERMELELGDPFTKGENEPTKEHFLPLLSLVKLLAGL